MCFGVFKIRYVFYFFSCLRFHRRTYCTSCLHSSCLLDAYHTPAAHNTVSHSAVLCNSHLHYSDYCCCLPPPRHFPSLVCTLCCPLTTLLYLLVQTLAVRVEYVEQETPPNRACYQREQLYSCLCIVRSFVTTVSNSIDFFLLCTAMSSFPSSAHYYQHYLHCLVANTLACST